jgi:DNA-binding NarL/FixJ family response regulator
MSAVSPLLQKDSSVPATTAQIAEELVVSLETVKSHLRELFSRFGLADAESREKRHLLVHKAVQSGTVSERDY